MIFKILLKYILGYVNISAEGYYIERFINTCISKGILLWNVKREKTTYMDANVGIQDFKRLKSIAKKTKCKITLNEKKGLPFIMNRYRKRKIFFAVLVIILISMFVTSKFIWNIEIEGTDKKDEILSALNQSGLSVGKLKSSINTQETINRIRLERDDIAWMSINLEGTNVIVKIVEREEKPEIIDENEYCNIVSNKKGQITKITAKTGTALVKVGDIVTENTILIGGWMEGKYTGVRYVHASGEVEAKVWYSKKEKMELEQVSLSKTGKEVKKYNIKLNNFQINLYKTLPNFEKYDTINEEKKIKLFSSFYLPITLGISTYYELEEKKISLTFEEAKEILVKKLESELSEEIENKDNINDIQINTKEYDNSIEVEVVYEVLESIGTEEKIIY